MAFGKEGECFYFSRRECIPIGDKKEQKYIENADPKQQLTFPLNSPRLGSILWQALQRASDKYNPAFSKHGYNKHGQDYLDALSALKDDLEAGEAEVSQTTRRKGEIAKTPILLMNGKEREYIFKIPTPYKEADFILKTQRGKKGQNGALKALALETNSPACMIITAFYMGWSTKQVRKLFEDTNFTNSLKEKGIRRWPKKGDRTKQKAIEAAHGLIARLDVGQVGIEDYYKALRTLRESEVIPTEEELQWLHTLKPRSELRQPRAVFDSLFGATIYRNPWIVKDGKELNRLWEEAENMYTTILLTAYLVSNY